MHDLFRVCVSLCMSCWRQSYAGPVGCLVSEGAHWGLERHTRAGCVEVAGSGAPEGVSGHSLTKTGQKQLESKPKEPELKVWFLIRFRLSVN